MAKRLESMLSGMCTTVYWAAAALCAVPGLAALTLAFTATDGSLAAAFADPGRLYVLSVETAKVTCGTTAVAVLFGVPAGFLVFRTDLPFRRFWMAGMLGIACLPVYVMAASWLRVMGLSIWQGNAWGAAWVGGTAYAPLVGLVSGAGFALIDRDLEDVARLETGSFRALFRATLPQASWAVAAGAFATMLFCLWEITITDILTVRTFGEEVYTQFQLGAGPARAAAMALPVVVLLGLMAIGVGRRLYRFAGVQVSGVMSPANVVKLRGMRWPVFAGMCVVAVCMYALPFAFLVSAVGSFRSLAMSLRVADRELLCSLWVSGLSATVTVILGVGPAWMLVRATSRVVRGAIVGWMLVLAAMPAPVVGIGLIRCLNHPGVGGMVYDAGGALVAAAIIRALPFAVLALTAGIARVPADIEDQIRIDGGGAWSIVLHALLPGALPAFAAAWCFSVVLSLAEIGASSLVAPPGVSTAGIRFFTLIHYGVYPDAAGLCVIVAVVAVILALAGGRFLMGATHESMGGRTA